MAVSQIVLKVSLGYVVILFDSRKPSSLVSLPYNCIRYFGSLLNEAAEWPSEGRSSGSERTREKNSLTSDGHARGAPVQTQASWLHATTVSVGCAEPTLLRMSQSVCFRLERNLSARVCEQQVQGNDKEHGGLASWLIKMKRLVAPSVYLQLHTHYSLCCLSLSPRPLRLTEPTFWPHAFPPR